MELNKAAASPPRVGPQTSLRAQKPPKQAPPDSADIQDNFSLSPREGTPIVPEAGRDYQVHQSSSRPIRLSFDQRAIAFFRNGNLKFDLEQAQIETSDGRRVPVDHRVGPNQSPRDKYAVEAGFKLSSEAEPWQFRVPGIPSQVFGKPHGVRLEGADQGFTLKFLDAEGEPIDRATAATQFDDFQGMRVDTPVFRRDRQRTLGQLASQTPAPKDSGPASLPFTEEVFEKVRFRSPTQAALDTVKGAFQKLLGPVVEKRAGTLDLEKLKLYEDEVQSIISKEVQAGRDVDGFAAMRKALDEPTALQAMQELYGPGSEVLDKEQLLHAVAKKAMRACPLEVVVIPRDKSALDCVETERPSTQEQLKRAGRAYFLQVNPFAYRLETGAEKLPSQRLFIGEEILETEQGVKAVLMHEMLHVFEHLYANDQETQQIESGFQGAKEFQSLYGANRDEYLTTVGEEFLATHGPDGPDWVRREHQPVYQLLSKLLDPR